MDSLISLDTIFGVPVSVIYNMIPSEIEANDYVKWSRYIGIVFFRFFSHIGYYKVLNIVPCVTQ